MFDTIDIQNAFEVAIGDGKPFANKLSHSVAIDGIDLSQNLIDIANLNKNINAKYANAEKPYEGKYDLVYCLRSFWYFEDWERVLLNMINSSNKYVIFDILNGNNKKLIFDEVNFRYTLFGKVYVAVKNTIKFFLNLFYRKQKYFLQPLIPIENYHFHKDIVEFINKRWENNIKIEFYGINSQNKNEVDNGKDYRIIYKLTKMEK